MRVFLAIELVDKVKNQLEYVQDQLEPHTNKGNFTDTDNFHLTLRFIGDVDQDEIKLLKSAIDQTVEKIDPFVLFIDTLGSFSKRKKEIIWAGVKGELDILHTLHNKLENNLEEQGFQKENRSYTPHITLGREIVLNEQLDGLKTEIEIPASKIKVEKISLMESTRIDGKLVYKPIYRAGFDK